VTSQTRVEGATAALACGLLSGYGNDSVQNGPFAEYNGSGRRVPGGSWAMGSFA